MVERYTTFRDAIRDLRKFYCNEEGTDDDLITAAGEAMQLSGAVGWIELERVALAVWNYANGDSLNPKSADDGYLKGSYLDCLLKGIVCGAYDCALRDAAKVLGVDAEGFAAIINDNTPASDWPQHQVTIETLRERAASCWTEAAIES